jgi:hypothetical protein
MHGLPNDKIKVMGEKFPILCYKTYQFRFKDESGKISIFDELRRKWLVCTPEEWVRQNLVRFLIEEFGFPANLIALEKSLILAGRNYRFDALVYDRDFAPLMIIECKAPHIKLEQKVFDQIWHYNYEINAPYYLITNGLTFVMGECRKNQSPGFFKEVKSFEQLIELNSQS